MKILNTFHFKEQLGKNLQSLGLIDKNSEYIGARTHEFCPHHVSHYLVSNNFLIMAIQ